MLSKNNFSTRAHLEFYYSLNSLKRMIISGIKKMYAIVLKIDLHECKTV